MSTPFSSTILRLPPGFRNLLEGLVMEVLRMQPPDIVGFAAQHFQTLLEQREGEWHSPAVPLLAPPASAACPPCVASGLPLCLLPRVLGLLMC